MNANDLKTILEKYKMWLNDEDGGEMANLSGADLRGADLRGADLTREQAATWFETMHPPGPGAREMYRMAAEALREPDEPLKNGRSQEHFEELRNLISDMSVVEIASHIETDNLSEYLGIWRYHAQKELLSIRQLFLEEDNP